LEEGSSHHQQRQDDHDHHGDPGNNIQGAIVDVLSHQVFIVDQQEHENEHKG
jgi:hypothetical protein